MCSACAEDRFIPADYGSRTVADARAWQARYAMPAERDTPTKAEAMRDDYEGRQA